MCDCDCTFETYSNRQLFIFIFMCWSNVIIKFFLFDKVSNFQYLLSIRYSIFIRFIDSWKLWNVSYMWKCYFFLFTSFPIIYTNERNKFSCMSKVGLNNDQAQKNIYYCESGKIHILLLFYFIFFYFWKRVRWKCLCKESKKVYKPTMTNIFFFVFFFNIHIEKIFLFYSKFFCLLVTYDLCSGLYKSMINRDTA